MSNILPRRYHDTPEFLKRPVDNDKLTAEELVAVQFWHQIDLRVQAQTRKAMRKIEGWDEKLPSDQWSNEIREIYLDTYARSEAETIMLLVDDKYTRAKLMAQARDIAADVAVSVGEMTERVQIRLILDIKESGGLSMLEGEYDNIAEYLASKRTPGNKSAGNYSETAFIVDVLIPVMEAHGISRDVIIGVAVNFGKAKIAIPFMRRLLGDGSRELTEAEMETLQYLIKSIITDSKEGGPTYEEFKERVERLQSGESVDDVQVEKPKIYGLVYNLAQGGIVQISVSNNAMLKTVMNTLNRIVDWHQSDPVELAKKAQATIMGEDLDDE